MSAINSLELEQFKNLIKNNKTWVGVMIYFRDNHNYKSISNVITVKKRCIREGIDISHFATVNKKYNLEEKMTQINKQYNSSTLKKKLIEQKILEEKCSNCGLGNIWQGSPISLQLEHIDGDHYNNNIENLTILCPNCHSQTNTWCGRNVHKCIDCNKNIRKNATRCQDCYIKIKSPEMGDKLCPDCNKIIHKDSIRCNKCTQNFRNKFRNKPTLNQLIEDQINMSFVEIGQKYKVKDYTIKKWIKNYKKQEAEPEPEPEHEPEQKVNKTCLDCNVQISKKSIRCQSCAAKNNNIPNRKVLDRPSLQQLNMDIKELKTMVAVGAKYKVSDNSIRKWIKGYNN
jgi:hypothetical protein